MSLKKRKSAFTLAEVMIVLLVLTLLLAIFAPMITKRRTTKKGDELWRWATRNYLAGPMDAFYQPENTDKNPSLFIGLSPDSKKEINDIYKPLGKVIIRGGYIDENSVQHQIQLRSGRASFEDIGVYAGSIFADNANLLMGSKYENLIPKISDASYPVNNISFGFQSLFSIGEVSTSATATDPARNNISIGFKSMEKLSGGDDNIAIGANSGSSNVTASGTTIVGADAGVRNVINYNTLIGYKSSAGTGSYNTFVGAGTGLQSNSGEQSFEYNTAIGYKALSSLSSGKYNIAIGSGALKSLRKGNFNVAIGYNACANLVNESYKTCIGYNSGPSADSGARAELGMGNNDKTQRTYIGSNPNLGNDNSWSVSTKSYGGDAVLELHNIGGNNPDLINNPSVGSNTTAVINGNLVVKGKTFLTVGDVLFPFSYQNNLFGANFDEPCSVNQITYAFNTIGNCSPLVNLTSDRRLKNIGTQFDAGLNEINKIKVYNYIFKSDKKKQKHTGVLAQELQKVFPNSVFKGEDGFLKIRWDEMFYASINAIKELNQKISTLIKQATNIETKINKLEEENEYLKAKSDELEKRVEFLKNKKLQK